MAYRYRDNGGATRKSSTRLKHLEKLGKIKKITGYRYLGRYNVNHEAVMVHGENGTARFSGFLWGYHGEGPRGLVHLLKVVGVAEELASKIAFETERRNENGVDWWLQRSMDDWQLVVPGNN